MAVKRRTTIKEWSPRCWASRWECRSFRSRARVELVEAAGGPAVRVTRVTPDGDELVEASCPVVVTISNELGEPRFPTTAKKIAARRMKPTIVSVDELSLPPEELQSEGEDDTAVRSHRPGKL